MALSRINRIHNWSNQIPQRTASLREIVSDLEVGKARTAAHTAALRAITEIDRFHGERDQCVATAKRGQPAFLYRVLGDGSRLSCGLATTDGGVTFITGQWIPTGDSFDCTGEWATTYGNAGLFETVVGQWSDHFLVNSPVGLHLVSQISQEKDYVYFPKERLWARWITKEHPLSIMD